MMEIIKANRYNVNQILKLEKTWRKEKISWGLFVPERVTRLREMKNAIIFLAQDKGKIIGYVDGEIEKADGDMPAWNIKKNQRYGEINSLYVLKDYRRQGVGTLLVRSLLDEFKRARLKIIKVKAVSKKLANLVNFYREFGFSERMIEMVLGTNSS